MHVVQDAGRRHPRPMSRPTEIFDRIVRFFDNSVWRR